MQTKYSIVKQAIKSKILDGTFQPHQKISSESELMKQFNVSRHTVRLAIGELVNQGWLYREQGAGTFCADRSKEENGQVPQNQKNIAIITTYISDYIFPSIIRGAESYLSQNGYHVSLFSTNNDHENERRFLEKILTQHFDGVIVEPTKSAISNPNINYYLNLERQNIPYIMINAYYDELEPLSITVNDELGGLKQTEHLIELGHENIVGFFKNDDGQGAKRMKGYLKAHRKHSLPINPNNIVTYRTEDKYHKPIEELEKLLALPEKERPTGLVCYNDELAITLLDVLRKRELQIPKDISIVGFDDSFLAEVSEVKLTTIKHPQSELGKKAAELILELVRDKNSNRQKMKETINSYVFEQELVIRQSTAKLNK
ncbi:MULTISPECIES: GntR family transcriptional regulator [Amphibacillus]|uniref:GntR family transcriptional regulator n=1 Tax=Amphibacillus TaxID=29331 RepID=UPI0002D7E335|nr:MULTISPECIES: GntR family transcriptional regulator [Amphibacillus]MBM7540936.1 GntR family transcriptional regulator of arabinose operon [Amphibacillus cookii]